MLLSRVERHLRRFGITATRFGQDALGDRAFVFDLRDGREPRPQTIARVNAYIAAIERQSVSRATAPSRFHHEGVTP